MAERADDCYFAALPDGQREIAEAVRRLVRSVAPEAREAFKLGALGMPTPARPYWEPSVIGEGLKPLTMR